MRNKSVWERACGLSRTVVEGVEFDDARGRDRGVGAAGREERVAGAGVCGRRSPGYDRGEGRRRWRALDLGTTKVFLEADAPRVRCRDAWGDGRGGAVGASRCRAHPRLR